MAYLNPEDQKIAAKRHYDQNTEKIKSRAYKFKKFARKRNRDFVRDYLSRNPCVDCKNTDIRVLDFDHVRGEKFSDISTMSRRAMSIEKISEEIEKCDVRCANCHRIKTHETLWSI